MVYLYLFTFFLFYLFILFFLFFLFFWFVSVSPLMSDTIQTRSLVWPERNHRCYKCIALR
jgi:hypothetical protein